LDCSRLAKVTHEVIDAAKQFTFGKKKILKKKKNIAVNASSSNCNQNLGFMFIGTSYKKTELISSLWK
jgi:hypothetical protein